MIQPFKTESIPLDFLEALRLSMNYGFISKNDIWDWAFKNIQQNEKYDTFLLELIEGYKPDARIIDFAIGKRTQGKNEIKNSKRILISHLCKNLEKNDISEKEVAKRLYKYTFDLDFEGKEKDTFYLFDNKIYIAEIGISGSINEIYEKLKETIKPYKKLRLNNYEVWEEINEHITKHITN